MRPLLAWLAICAALSPAACYPIDAAARADVDRRLAALSPAGPPVAAPEGTAPMPLAAGQWATYKVVGSSGKPSFLTMKLVGQEGSAFWYEELEETYYGKYANRMLVDFGDRKSRKVTIKDIKNKGPDGRVTVVPNDHLVDAALVGSYLDNMGPVALEWTGRSQEKVSVPAGTFTACYKDQFRVTTPGYSSVTAAWGHPAVPFAGVVRSVTDEHIVRQGSWDQDIRTTLELVAYGTTGARSEF